MSRNKNRPPLTNTEALERCISDLALESGILLKDGFPGFAPDAAPTLPLVAEEKDYAAAIWPWRRLMAECVNYLTIQSLAYQRLVQKEVKPQANFFRASWSLSTQAAYNARCALHLCDHGYVTQAAIVTRSCIESIEAMTSFVLERSHADQFVSAETPDEANHAWFRLIRKKARRAMDAAFEEVVSIDHGTREWRAQNRRLLNTLTHPSYLASTLNLYADWEEGREPHPTLPARTMDSVTVFQTTADACFEHASLLLLTLLGRKDPSSSDDTAPGASYENVGFFNEDWLDSYASRGHKFFQRLWIFYVEHQDYPPLSNWRRP